MGGRAGLDYESLSPNSSDPATDILLQALERAFVDPGLTASGSPGHSSGEQNIEINCVRPAICPPGKTRIASIKTLYSAMDIECDEQVETHTSTRGSSYRGRGSRDRC